MNVFDAKDMIQKTKDIEINFLSNGFSNLQIDKVLKVLL